MADKNTILQAAQIQPGSRLAKVIEGRADILALSQATHDAILNPQEPGDISHAERAAFVCRIARLNGDETLAAHYATRLPKHLAEDRTARIADPTYKGDGNTRLAALIKHVDLVTRAPQNATEGDITALIDAGIGESDIVRLVELIAFINYQIRVVTGLRLMGEIA